MRHWAFAFAASATLAGVMLAATLRSEELRPREAAELSDVDIELLINKLREGDLLAIRKDFDGARRAWSEVRRRGAGIWMVHEGLGDSLRRAGLGVEALREYGDAAELAPPTAVAAITAKRGRTLAELDRPLDALRAFLEAGPAGDRAQLLRAAERVGAAEAVKECRARAEIDPRAFAVLAELLGRQGKGEDKLEAMTEYFLRATPWDPSMAQDLIFLLERLGRVDRALEICRAWAKAVPMAIEPWKRMGDLLRAAGREKEALAAYTSIVDIRPGQAEAHRALAGIFREIGRREDAVAQLEAARRARPEDRQTWVDLLAVAGEAAGDRLAAEAVGKFPDEPAFRGRALEALRREIRRLPPEEAVARRRALALSGLHELGYYDLKVTLTWDVDGDVDLDVHEPGGEVVFHGHPSSKPGGKYYVDDTQRRGPETYTLAAAPKGSYRAGVHLHGEGRATARVEIVVHEGTSKERRWVETATLEKGGDKKLFAPFEIR